MKINKYTKREEADLIKKTGFIKTLKTFLLMEMKTLFICLKQLISAVCFDL